jgi:hypothetical protein
MVISASMTRTLTPPNRDSQDPSGRRRRTGSFGALFPVRTRIRKSAFVCVIFRARNPAAKFRSASSSIPARRLGSSRGVHVVSPQETGRNTASITVRVPQLTRASSRSCG